MTKSEEPDLIYKGEARQNDFQIQWHFLIHVSNKTTK